MRDNTLIGPWVRRFLLEHLVTERNLARNTQLSYRDTLVLLLPFLSKAQGRPVDRLTIDDLSPARVRSFLQSLEKKRGCSGATRNLRLATRFIRLSISTAFTSKCATAARCGPRRCTWPSA
jgi:integrase/recombinase XerD